MLSVDVSHGFGAFTLDVAFEAPGGITVLFGPSGSGKTSVVKAVAGLLQPDRGRIALPDALLFDSAAGVSVPPHRRRIGYVFQEARLFPHMTVRGNLGYGRRFAPRAMGPDDAAKEFDRVVGLLGLGPLLDRRPRDLSGGETQRVAIGRALLSRPSLVLADEPLASLDMARKEEILPYFEGLRDELKVPILYVSHAANEVARLATTIVVLQNGRVVRSGPAAEVLGDPDILPLGPRDAGALLEARVVRHHEDGLTELDAGGHALFLPRLSHAPGQVMRVRIAAQDVMLARSRPEGLSALNILPGRIEVVREGTGPGVMIAIETTAGRILSRVTRRSAAALGLSVGTEVYAVVKTVSVAPGDVGGSHGPV
jgi:molybdate transport system ATP-binding protein